MLKIEILLKSNDIKELTKNEANNNIFVVYGYFHNSHDIEIIKAFEYFRDVEPFIMNCFASKENPYRKIIWESTTLIKGE